ncbi:MAG: hypothetical protein IPL79_13510 [Myxococcales bacterium]|nr:hypothetical protein [Myxococcales bacterium]
MRATTRCCLATSFFLVAGCGNDGDGSATDAEASTPGACVDGLDNDGNGEMDCDDASCIPTAACGPDSGDLRVFVTSQRYPANLRAAGGGASGLASADNLCQLSADAAALGGQWVAWLSSTDADALDRITGAGPWYRTDGTLAFPNKASLATVPQVALSYDEHGDMPDPFYEAWTGTALGGRVAPADGDLVSTTCDDWTTTIDSETIKGWLGDIDEADFNWTAYADGYCWGFDRRLYCFEQ